MASAAGSTASKVAAGALCVLLVLSIGRPASFAWETEERKKLTPEECKEICQNTANLLCEDLGYCTGPADRCQKCKDKTGLCIDDCLNPKKKSFPNDVWKVWRDHVAMHIDLPSRCVFYFSFVLLLFIYLPLIWWWLTNRKLYVCRVACAAIYSTKYCICFIFALAFGVRRIYAA